MRNTLRYFIFCFILNLFFLNHFVLAVNSAVRENENSTDFAQSLIVDADDVEYLEENYKIIGTNNVKINYEGVLLTCDNIEVDLKKKDVLALGNVVICYEQIMITGEKLTYNFTNKQGFIECFKDAVSSDRKKKVVVYYDNIKLISESVEFNLIENKVTAIKNVKGFYQDIEFNGQRLDYSFALRKGCLLADCSDTDSLVRAKHLDHKISAKRIDFDLNKNEVVCLGNVKVVYKDVRMRGTRFKYNFTDKLGCIKSYNVGGDKDISEYGAVITQADKKIISKYINFDLQKQIAETKSKVYFFQAGNKLSGKDLIYNFSTKTGMLRHLKVESSPWFFKADKIEQINPQMISVENAYITTCNLEKPHYRIWSKKFTYYDKDKIVAKNAFFYLGNIPIMYLPLWKYSLKENASNLSLTCGNKKEWGWFEVSAWHYYLNESLKGDIHLDYRQYKGFASGLDLDYKLLDYGFGQIRTYHMNERDTYKDNFSEQERYRAQIKHRWEINPSTLALLEYNKMSDFGFIKDYLYKEYEGDVQPLSEGSISYHKPLYNLSLYARKRTNHFYSEVERLPEVKYDLNSIKFFNTNFYYRNELSAVNLNKKNANNNIDTDVNRIDTYHELNYPTKLPGDFAWLNINPYIGTRQTYYSKDKNGGEHNLTRGIYYYGFDLNTKFFSISPYTGRFLGIEINKLRHTIVPGIKYNYLHNPTVPAEKLGDFDEIDSLGKENFFTLGVENYLQTKRLNLTDNNYNTLGLIYFYPYVNYYRNVNTEGRHFSHIKIEFNIKPYQWLSFNSDTEYNQYGRRFQVANFDLRVNNCDQWDLSIGKRYDRDVSEQVTADFYYKVNRFWQFRTYCRYESYTHSFQEQQYTFYRDLHCWLLEATYDIKEDETGSVDDRTIWFIFRLKAFPNQTPIKFNAGYETTKRHL
ncbi:MAG: hypothetical protein DRP78_02700 [Candidatus Omnitrophota bacterium]|nr:MAG: hypothetical protein DRP78_02700 [Candidatus Omnitrophota bacterium]